MSHNHKTLENLYFDLHCRIGRQPTRKDWNADNHTPSDMVIRSRFGSWGKFLDKIGVAPKKYIPSKNGVTRAGTKNKNRKRIINDNGYIQIYSPLHPASMSNGYCLEHRMIAFDLGILNNLNDIVHHIDENKTNNVPSNLICLQNSDHTSMHHKGERKPRKGSIQCKYPECKNITSSKYSLCAIHYKKRWQQKKQGLIDTIEI